MRVAQQMEAKLKQAFAPQMIEVIDDSDRHAGHAGGREGGETHFKVVLVSDFFSELSRIERHRAVHNLLAEELAGSVHALNITALTPQEARIG